MIDGTKAKDNPVYTISVAAKLLGVSVQTLRLYEREGLIISFKTKGNQRLYSISDIERIKRIRQDIVEYKIGIRSLRTVLSLVPCWMIVECTEIDRENCESFNEHYKPCWTTNTLKTFVKKLNAENVLSISSTPILKELEKQ